MRLRLPCSLLDLVPEADRVQGAGSASVPLAARSWTELVEELRGRFPLLAERTLTDAGTPRAGFALVINDEVVPAGGGPVAVGPGDELSLIAVIAGGSRSPGFHWRD